MTSARVRDAETNENNRKNKGLVFRVEVSRDNATWCIHRRYNEFVKLCEIAKKQVCYAKKPLDSCTSQKIIFRLLTCN
jgi:hypothetical protein